MEEKKPLIGPFRATRLWNTIVIDFRAGIPQKRHRWKMRFYDDCFMTNEAVDWLHNYLQTNENYGPWVTRQQAIQLLEKFVHSRVIESVKPLKEGSRELFEDNGSLYKLVHRSPIKKLRSALHGRNNLKTLTPSPQKSRTRAPLRPLSLNTKLMNADESERWNIKDKLSSLEANVVKPNVVGPSQRRRQSKPALLKRTRSLGEMDRSSSSAQPVESSEDDIQTFKKERTENTWKDATLTRLKRLLWLFTLEGVVDVNILKGEHIVHNSTHLSRSGVVVLSDKSEDLPHWVLSAMKCIANWPQKQDSDLPNYPGFEKDVFHTISNYFQNLEEPLMTFDLYNLVLQAYALGQNRDRDRYKSEESGNISQSRHIPCSDKWSTNKCASFKKVKQRDSARQVNERQQFGSHERIFCITKSRSVGQLNVLSQECGQDDNHFKKFCAPTSRNILSRNVSTPTIHRSQSMRTQQECLPERDFLSNGRPRSFAGASPNEDYVNLAHTSAKGDMQSSKRGFSRAKFQSTGNLHHCSQTSQDEGTKLTHSESKRSLFLSKKFGSASDLFQKLLKKKWVSKDAVNGSVPDIVASTLHCSQKRSKSLSPQGDVQFFSSLESSSQTRSKSLSPQNPPLLVSKESASSLRSFTSPESDDELKSKKTSPSYPAPMRATLSVSEIVKSDPEGQSLNPHIFLDSARSFAAKAPFYRDKSASTVELRTSTGSSAPAGTCDTSATEISSRLQLESDKSYCEEAMRLTLLLLPPANRRKLHLLMKMMSKIERNDELQLYPEESKRELLLHTFSRSILRTVSEVDFDETYANRIVSYLLDNFNTILAPSIALRADVEERLNQGQRAQMNCNSTFYCKQLTKEEYKEEGETNSYKAIEDLLETMIADRGMDVKEKKKRLKLFQKAYPEIYKKRLPTAESEAEVFPTKPKIKQPMLKRSLTILKPVR